jgi:hypothetical protein
MTASEKAEIFDSLQQVLRGMVVSIAGASNADMTKLAGLLNDSANAPNLSKEARVMLRDLAQGPQILGQIKKNSEA